jgi:predicted nucleic acid-binding protein
VILVDTSVWIDHFRTGVPALVERLEQFEVATHPFVIGELALGSLRQRELVLALLGGLSTATIAHHQEVLDFIASSGLWGRGIGYVDVHLLAACHLSPGMRLWTRDKRLTSIAEEQGVTAGLD